MTVVVGLQFVKAELYYQEIIDLITMDHSEILKIPLKYLIGGLF